MNKKLFFKRKAFFAIVLSIVLGFSPALPAFAQDNVISETLLAEEAESLQFSVGDSLTLDDFFWPDAEGKYYVNYNEDVIDGKDYMLFVVAGKIDSVSDYSSDAIVRNVIYINQTKASNGVVSFNGFKPSRDTNATVIISGEGLGARIVGYISRDLFSVLGYSSSGDSMVQMDDCFVVTGNTSYDEAIAILPQNAFAQISSDFTEDIFVPVSFSWDCDEIYAPERGKTFAFTGQSRITDTTGIPDGFENLLRPITVSVTVSDEHAGLVDITVSKSKVLFEKGETVSVDDIHVRGIYDDGTVRTMSDYTVDSSEVSSDRTGEQNIKVTAGDITKDIKITVVENRAASGQYQVTFNSNGGSYIAPVVVKGKIAAMPTDPVKNGFIFTGWYTDASCTQLFDKDTVLNSDITLYAGWFNERSVIPSSLIVKLDTTTVDMDVPLTEGQINVWVKLSNGDTYELDDFSTNLAYIDQTTAGEKTLEVTAKAQGIPLDAEAVFYVIDSANTEAYLVSFDTGIDGKTITPQLVLSGMSAVEPKAPEKDGYIFLGWTYEDKLWDFNTVVNSDMQLTAKWLVGELIGGEGSDFFVYFEDRQTFVYTGKALKPVPVVMDNNFNVLKDKKDYTVTYSNNTNASTPGNTAKMVITGKGNYSGSTTKEFVIEQKNISGDDTTVKMTDTYAYKAAGITPKLSINSGGKALKSNTDYTLSYRKLASSDDEVGTAVDAPLKDTGLYRVVITGKGNYTGSTSADLVIGASDAVNLSTAKITVGKNYKNVNYTGFDITVNDITVSGKAGKKNKTLSAGTDYVLVYKGDHRNPGKVTVDVKAAEGSTTCYGHKEFTFNIVGVQMKDTKLALKTNQIVFDGKVHNDNLSGISIKVTAKNKDMINRFSGGSYQVNSMYNLVEGRDYSVVTSNSLKAGTATITATGIGLFSGEKSGTFKITARNITDPGITVKVYDAPVSKSGAIPKIDIIYHSGDVKIVLQKGLDYKAAFSSNTQAGKVAKAKITGTGNFKASTTVNFLVNAKNLKNDDISIDVCSMLVSNKVKAGGIYKPTVTVKDAAKALKAGTDYIVDYAGCVTFEQMEGNDVCEGYVVIKGNNKDYSGVIRKYYTVTRNNLASANIVIKDQFFTGKEITFTADGSGNGDEITATLQTGSGSKDLILGKDFKITSYTKNINVGTATVTLQGTGDLAGTKKVSFKIVKCPIH